MTDNEIIKALDCHRRGCKKLEKYCPYAYRENCSFLMACDVYDLINRQKARIENYIELVKDSQSQTKTAIEQFDQLKEVAYSQKAEIESLKRRLHNAQLHQKETHKALLKEQQLRRLAFSEDFIKAEAIKEFAERLKELIPHFSDGYTTMDCVEGAVKHLVKEMVVMFDGVVDN